MSKKTSRAKTVDHLLGCYYIYGSAGLLLEQAVARLLGMFAEIGADEIDCSRFEGAEAMGDEVIGACRTLPFMAPRRLVIVRAAESLTADAKQEICEYLRSRGEGDNSVLVLVESRVSQDGKSLVDRRGRLYKTVGELGQASEYSFGEAQGGVQGWLRNRFAARDKVITTAAARLLENCFGNDLVALSGEVEKICLYCTDVKKIDIPDMAPVLHATPEAGAFDLTSALTSKDKVEAVILVRKLSEKDEASRLLSLLETQFRLLLAAKTLGESRPEQLAVRLKIKPGRAYYLLKECKIVSTAFLSKATRLLAQADFNRKSGRGEPGEVLEDFVLELLTSRAGLASVTSRTSYCRRCCDE